MARKSWCSKLLRPSRTRPIVASLSRGLTRLESREVPATFVVNTVVDETNGIGIGGVSLRDAIVAANNSPGPDTITFDTAGAFANPATITMVFPTLFLTDTSGPTTIIGPGADRLTVSGNTGFRVFDVSGQAVISGLSIRNGLGNSGAGGAGINVFGLSAILTLSDVEIRNNTSFISGGGIDVSSGVVTIVNSTIADNFNTNTAGGGMRVSGGTVTVINSTIANNSSATGGGLFHTGGSLKFVNSTFAGNIANNSGGIHFQGGDLTINNSLIVGNKAVNSSGGFSVNNNGMSMYSSLVLGNFAANNPDSNFTVFGFNNQYGFPAGITSLGEVVRTVTPTTPELANYGRPTRTVGLVGTSPAIDFGDPGLAVGVGNTPLTTDQRGFQRSQFAKVDAGAFEANRVDLNLPTVTTSDGALWYLGGGTAADRVVVREVGGNSQVVAGVTGNQIARLADGTVFVRNSGGEVYARLGSDTGVGSDWQQQDAVTTTVGATWFLSTESAGGGSFQIYRWDGTGTVNAGGAGARLGIMGDNGPVVTWLTNGQVYVRPGSNAGDGSPWELLTSVQAADGASWFFSNQVNPNGTRAIYRLGGVGPLFDAEFEATNLLRLDDGSVGAWTAANGFFLCIDSASGPSSYWDQPNSVVAADGATWFLSTGAVPPTADARVFRWADASGPVDTSGTGVRLTVTPAGVVRARTAGGGLFERVGSQSGLGSSWVFIPESLTVSTLVDEDNGAANPSDGTGVSLREAIAYAQAKLGPDTITFAGSLSGTVTLNGSELFIDAIGGPLTILGPGAGKLAVSGDLKSRVFNLDDYSVSTISGLSIINGSDIVVGPYGTYGYGGAGVYVGEYARLTLASCVISGNTADGDGGGVYMDYGSEVLITDCLVTGNLADGDGGGIYNDGGSLTIVGSSITGNTTNDDGGGIDTWGPTVISGSNISGNWADDEGGGARISDSLTMINTTVSGNTSNSDGGGLNFNDDNPVLLVNSTIAGNTAAGQGGGAYVYYYSGTYGTYGAPVTAINTIISGNSAAQGADLFNSLTPASSNNLIGLSAAAAGLGTLANNGGPTQTIALLPGSPAINAGMALPGITRDQRAVTRDGAVDIGAYEYSFARSLIVTTTADENNGTSDPSVGAGTSLREAITAAQQPIATSGFGSNGTGWTRVNGLNTGLPLVIGGPLPSDDAVTLTTAEQGMSSALWYNQKINVNNFTVSFRYTQDRGTSGADGFTLAFQNAGLNVGGAGGGGLGYSGLGASAAIGFNIYGGNTVGVAAFVNGSVSNTYVTPGNGVSLTNGEPVDVSITSVGPAVTVTLTQGTNSFTYNFPTLNIAGQVGGPAAYVGFTAATGGARATQVVSRFNLSSAPLPATVTFAPALGGQTVTLTDGWTSPTSPTAIDILSNVTIQGPTTAPGITLAVGGMTPRRHFYVNPSGALTISHLTLTGGTAADYGGAIWSQGSLTVRNSTFTGNSAGGEGGAIQTWGGSPQFLIENSTIAGNTTGNAGSAMGIGSVSASATNVTIVDNVGPAANSAVWIYETALTLSNSIIARNTGDGATTNGGTGTGTFSAASANNVLGTGNWPGLTNGVNNNSLGVTNLGLGTLADNGGPTQTVAILPGSLAIDAGNSTITTDQRGLPRAGAPDIGAFELQGTPSKISAVSINGGAVQRSRVTTIEVTFDQPPSFAGAPAAAFTLTRQGGGQQPALSAALSGNTVTLSFLAGTGVEFGSLIDGRYTLTVNAAQVTNGLDGDGNGTPGDDYTLVGTPANGLFRLFGDATGDGTVDTADFLAFRLGFLQPSAAAIFDATGDGQVDAADFLAFRLQFLDTV